MYFNAHTHINRPNANEISVFNLHQNFIDAEKKGFFSIGLHPWYISSETWQQQLQEIQATCGFKNILAIGEVGLDKKCATSFQLQKKVFEAHIQLACAIKKPLIIHCVRAYAETIELLTHYKLTVPVLFHGFSKSKELASRLMARGYYLSFGQGLMQAKLRAMVATLPLSQLLLETDNSSLTIQEVYSFAANALEITEDSLSLQLSKNAANFFGTAILDYNE